MSDLQSMTRYHGHVQALYATRKTNMTSAHVRHLRSLLQNSAAERQTPVGRLADLGWGIGYLIC